MKSLALPASLLALAAAIALHAVAPAVAADVTAPAYEATCITVPQDAVFAESAQWWMRLEQKKGASGFQMTGTTVCAY
ncbi:MAG: hypothetical protein H6733_12150 [Alphaproteobacteria bacterium]|nr:hypothetical protein [Alphaproteobacteria bacterium]